jgi:hypothetical protein
VCVCEHTICMQNDMCIEQNVHVCACVCVCMCDLPTPYSAID